VGLQVAVAGASGYAGGEVLRLLAGHPELEVAAATAYEQAGRPLGEVHPQLVTLSDLVLQKTSVETLADADLVFLALPHGQSAALAEKLPRQTAIVDLGADFRLTDENAWERYYGGAYAGSWAYGLPELPGQREVIAGAKRVANTGCYAVASILALAPLIASGIAEPEDVVIVAASGTSGAGRAAKPHLLGSEVMGDLSPYKIGAHQHVAEIKQASKAKTVSMTPVLAPMPRGILSTVTAKPTKKIKAEDVREVLQAAYGDEPFVHVLPDGQMPHTAATFGSNSAHLQAAVDIDSGRIIVTSAIDNLGKGAAGQAVQNANIVLGLPETTGLPINGVAP
jgi:N-acetyl-gamma-glutamyl-phosphate reductase